MSRRNVPESKQADFFEEPLDSTSSSDGNAPDAVAGSVAEAKSGPPEKPTVRKKQKGSGKPSSKPRKTAASATASPRPVAVGRVDTAHIEVRYLSDRQVAQRLSISRASVWRMRNHYPEFPQPFTLMAGCTRWRIEDLRAFENAYLERDHD